MADFKEGINYQKGDIVSEQARTEIGAKTYFNPLTQKTEVNRITGTNIYHRTVTRITSQDQNENIKGSQTEVWVIADKKDGKGDQWVKAYTTTDGGRTKTFNEETRSDGSKVISDALKKDLTNSNSPIGKNVSRQINLSADKAGISKQSKEVLDKSLKNKENQPNTNGSSSTQTKSEDWNKAVGNSSKSRIAFPTLYYPLAMRTSKQDKIHFEMVKYSPSTFSSASGQFGWNRASERKNREVIGNVYLPIPSGITETTGAKWGDDEAGPGKTAAANIAMGGITGGGEGFTKAIEGQLGALQGASGDVKTAIAGQIAGEASGIGGGLLTRMTGAVLNPNLELLFGGGTLRPFNFTFKLSARSQEEAKQIIGIIRFFKQGMAPQRSDSNLFLKSPHTFRIKYLHQEKEHKFLNKFKECALQNFTVDYTPEGQYATYYDGMMVSYQITMQFQELEPIFNEDYGPGTGSGGPDTEIGF